MAYKEEKENQNMIGQKKKKPDGGFRLLNVWMRVSANPLPQKQNKTRKIVTNNHFRSLGIDQKADSRLRSYSVKLLNLERNSGSLWNFSRGLLPSSSFHPVPLCGSSTRMWQRGWLYFKQNAAKSMLKKYWRKFFRLKGNNNCNSNPHKRIKKTSKGKSINKFFSY